MIDLTTGVWGGLESWERNSGDVKCSDVITLSPAEPQRCFMERDDGGDLTKGFKNWSLGVSEGAGEEREGVLCREKDGVDCLVCAGEFWTLNWLRNMLGLNCARLLANSEVDVS